MPSSGSNSSSGGGFGGLGGGTPTSTSSSLVLHGTAVNYFTGAAVPVKADTAAFGAGLAGLLAAFAL